MCKRFHEGWPEQRFAPATFGGDEVQGVIRTGDEGVPAAYGAYGGDCAGSRAGSDRRADVIVVNQGTHTEAAPLGGFVSAPADHTTESPGPCAALPQSTYTDCRLGSEPLRVPGPSPEGAVSHDDHT
ncbi:hypothetical protein [Streptomyces canus]|uniref:Uncharacterized protein n=1 Tax=Streptomyces canus TaxID=58343 RepID=A0AAW8F9D2_9ACTN|nr:hypothetical protein [Streptomyces canus]MDQ0906168.1 hypothetical protein [Streptomyces canus]MDQ1066114.1 hypothetical protein [Streptomyces canus]